MHASVTVIIGRAALVDSFSVAFAVFAVMLLIRFHVNSTWLIAAGGAIGVLWL